MSACSSSSSPMPATAAASNASSSSPASAPHAARPEPASAASPTPSPLRRYARAIAGPTDPGWHTKFGSVLGGHRVGGDVHLRDVVLGLDGPGFAGVGGAEGHPATGAGAVVPLVDHRRAARAGELERV